MAAPLCVLPGTAVLGAPVVLTGTDWTRLGFGAVKKRQHPPNAIPKALNHNLVGLQDFENLLSQTAYCVGGGFVASTSSSSIEP